MVEIQNIYNCLIIVIKRVAANAQKREIYQNNSNRKAAKVNVKSDYF